MAGVDRSRLMFTDDPGDGFEQAFDELVAARSRRIPLQHLIGTAPFGPLTLAVGPGVFVPRPETEVLVGLALAVLDMYPHQRGLASSLQAFVQLMISTVVAGVVSPLLSASPLHLALGQAAFFFLVWRRRRIVALV